MRPAEVVVEVSESPEGGFEARARGFSIFSQGEDWDDLKKMVRDAVLCHFEDEHLPRAIRLRFTREEVIAANTPVSDGQSR